MRVASGSLGQGLSVAIGAALSKKLNNDDKTVFALMGDGELQEGQNWEAIMYAAGKKVDNLIATVDLNGKQIDGSTDDVLPMGNCSKMNIRLGSPSLEEGNDLNHYRNVGWPKPNGKGQPVVIIMHTEMGNGVDYMMQTHAWHGKAPNDEQQVALSQTRRH